MIQPSSDKSSRPSVSIIMGVCDGEAYLRECVDSILAQTFQDFEFIVVDDGSVDRTTEILASFAQADPRVIAVRRERIGLTKALNVAAKAARGEFIARMDADDIADPARLQRQVDYLRNHPDCALLGSRVLLIDQDGRPLCFRPHDSEHGKLLGRLLKGDGGALTHPAVIFRRADFEAIGGYDERFVTTQDLDLFIRLAQRGRIHNLNEVLLKWRQHARSVNRTQTQTWQAMKSLALTKAVESMGLDRYIEAVVATSGGFEQDDWSHVCCDMAIEAQFHRSALQLAAKAFRSRTDRRRAANRILKILARMLMKAYGRCVDRITRRT